MIIIVIIIIIIIIITYSCSEWSVLEILGKEKTQ